MGLATTGRLYNFTIVYRRFPGVAVPFVSAAVDLDGGGTVKGNLLDVPAQLMCSVNVDGSAAAVLVSERKVRELGLMARAIRIRGSRLASDPFTERNLVMADVSSVTRLAARSAYDMAGVAPEDIDVVELHDCFATAEIVHYENLGLCADGDGGALLDSGATTLGGRVPVNLSGGLLSKGHPLGATGLANVYEIATQLRGEAGPRQHEGARIGLTHVVGLGSACAVHILEKA